MNTIAADTGIADLLLIYAVKSLLTGTRPDLERLVVVDQEHPRLSFPTPGGAVVVEKSDTTGAGTWTVSVPGRGVMQSAPGAQDIVGLALGAREPHAGRMASAA